MDILLFIPVWVNGPETIPCLLQDVRERIAQRAYENFVERGCVHGHDFDDWLNAERDLIIKPTPLVSATAEDVFVEMFLPEIDFPSLTVHVAPTQLVVSSNPDDQCLRLCQVIDLPCEISPDSVDAERLRTALYITASVARAHQEQ